MSDFWLQPWPGTIAITTLLEFCSWLLKIEKESIDENAKEKREPTPEFNVDSCSPGYELC